VPIAGIVRAQVEPFSPNPRLALKRTEAAPGWAFVPRYYFHLYNDIDAPDQEGHEFPDIATAWTYAQKQARAMIAATVTETWCLVLSHRIDIADGDGAVVRSVTFGDAVTIKQ